MQNWRNYFNKSQKKLQSYENYHLSCFSPSINSKDEISDKDLEVKVKEIFEWAKSRGARYFTFFAYPRNEGVLEKQETFLDLEYFYKNTLESSGSMNLSFKSIEKGESDGSSFPSGGLRQTPKARAYTIWDLRSEVFVRPTSKVLYIPSLLVSHNGEALDDKTIFRRAERKLETSVIQLLSKVGVQAKSAVMALGLEQQFFVIKKDAYMKRLDLRNAGRSLAGKIPPKTQQFSDHYYGKLPRKIEQVLSELEDELLQIGIPVKTRHKQVAPNQFQFVPLFGEAGKTIDHNMIMMEIFKEKFQKAGLTALFHEKPFCQINGSGKHANWSLNYVDTEGKLVNLFECPKNHDEKQILIFKLFVLIQLKALLVHSKLYLASIACSGNQLRLGGHQAPPRILSAFLGDAATALIMGKDLDKRKNFKQDLPNINFNLLQENTDRNRTSPYAFTGNKFEYRAVGSSQNPAFPMAVIAATIAKQIDEVLKRIDKGEQIKDIMDELTKQTELIVYNGNGYSSEWVQEAKKRGIYVNENFYENFENIKDSGKVFVELGICKQNQVIAKAKIMEDNYKNTVETELNTLKHIISSEIIPRCYEFLSVTGNTNASQKINKRAKKFIQAFDEVLEKQELLNEWEGSNEMVDYANLRKDIFAVTETINNVLGLLPKRSSWPEFEDFINDY